MAALLVSVSLVKRQAAAITTFKWHGGLGAEPPESQGVCGAQPPRMQGVRGAQPPGIAGGLRGGAAPPLKDF